MITAILALFSPKYKLKQGMSIFTKASTLFEQAVADAGHRIDKAQTKLGEAKAKIASARMKASDKYLQLIQKFENKIQEAEGSNINQVSQLREIKRQAENAKKNLENLFKKEG